MRALTIIFGILLFSSCAVGPGGPCAKNEDCDSQLSCLIPSDQPSSVDPALTYRDLAVRLEANTCVSVEELRSAASALGLEAKQKACRESQKCSAWGWCTYQDDACVSGSDEDCRASQICGLFGRCVLGDGECRAGADEDCQNSTTCETMNYCRVNERGFCVE